MFEFQMSEGTGKMIFCLDRPEYTAFPEEREVLLFDGFNAIVDRVDNIESNGRKMTVVNLRSKAKKKSKHDDTIKQL